MDGNCNNAIQSSNQIKFSNNFGSGSKEGLFGKPFSSQGDKQQFGGVSSEKFNIFGKLSDQDNNKAPKWNSASSSSSASEFKFNVSGKPKAEMFGKSIGGEQEKLPPFSFSDSQNRKTLFGKVRDDQKGKSTESDNKFTSSSSKPSFELDDSSRPKNTLFGKGRLAQDEIEKGPREKKILFGKETSVPYGSKSVDPSKRFLHSRLAHGNSTFMGKKPTAQGNRTWLICKKIPMKFNKKDILRKHFEIFGEVIKISNFSHKNLAFIYFVDPQAASEAKKHGTKIQGMKNELEIIFGRPNRVISSQIGAQETPKTASVDDELSTMEGTADIRNDLNFPNLTQEPPLKNIRPRPASPVRVDSPVNSRSVSPAPIRLTETAYGKTSAEKWLILENFDKKYRKSIKDKQRRGHVIGTCPDMCPEKERYFREDKRRLSIYEVVPGQDIVDHSRAVKEYSRSSADQEMPLPHEVRPVAVLEKTMNYLLQTVLKMPDEGHWDEWYNFLWDRTRAIRKDITQQQLCDTSTVGLIEKCARFHIYCSHRLCELHMAVFDKKINNENLTKCLQTLKELYKDLESKGVFCPNEAEFRSYIVLMNLNGGDCLREVQQLRFDIRESKQVRFVVKVHQSLNANNYVRFFKLVKRASFLQAAILHRYFVQVRTSALQVMCKSYTANTQIPIGDLVEQLSFEDEIQAQEFFQHFGIEISNQFVFLNPKSFIKPEAEFKLKRAIRIVEIKMIEPLEEIINGGPLEKLVVEEPTPSFDKEGKFRLQLYMQHPPEEPEVCEKTERADEEFVNNIAEKVLNETCKDYIYSIIEEVHDNETVLSKIRVNICSDLITTTVNLYIA